MIKMNHLKLIVWIGFTVGPAMFMLLFGLSWSDIIDRSVNIGSALIVLAFLEKKNKQIS